MAKTTHLKALIFIRRRDKYPAEAYDNYYLLSVYSTGILKYIKHLMSLSEKQVDNILYGLVEQCSRISITPGLKARIIDSPRLKISHFYYASQCPSYRYENGKWYTDNTPNNPLYILDENELDEYMDTAGYQKPEQTPVQIIGNNPNIKFVGLPIGTVVDVYSSYYADSAIYKIRPNDELQRLFVRHPGNLYVYVNKNQTIIAVNAKSIVRRYWLPSGEHLQEENK